MVFNWSSDHLCCFIVKLSLKVIQQPNLYSHYVKLLNCLIFKSEYLYF